MSSYKSKKVIGGIICILTVIYPFLVYYTWQKFAFYFIAGIVALTMLKALLFGQRSLFCMATIVGLLVGVTFILNEQIAAMLYPTLMSLAWAFFFAYTLINPPTFIERIARLADPNLDIAGVKYTRKVTILWLVYCLINAVISLMTIILDNLSLWTLYNGCISYLLMGVLISGEYVYRKMIITRKAKLEHE